MRVCHGNFAMFLRSIIAVLMIFSELAAFAASSENRMSYYQTQLSGKASGVYENEGDLYVHVRQVPLKKSDRKRMEMKAVLSAKDLLTRWMLDYVATERATGTQIIGPGLKQAVKVLDSINPAWRYSDVQYDIRGQEFNLGVKDGYFTFGQVYAKADVVRAIPAAYSQAPTKAMVRKYLKVLLPLALKADAQRLYHDCGAKDLEEKASNVPFVSELHDYLATSDCAKRLRENMERMQCSETVSWRETPEDVKSRKEEKVDCVTNVIEKIVYVTNHLERVQSADERKAMGMALGGNVSEVDISSEEEEVVKTRTTTTVVVKRFRRVRTRVHVSGEARFEQLFLSSGDGVTAQDSRAQTSMGAAAAKSFYGEDAYDEKRAKIEDALRENPYDAGLWNLLGRLFFMQKDFLGALNCYRLAIRLDPQLAFALTNLSLVYEKLGAQDAALGYAILVLGTANDAWCTAKAEGIVFDKNKEVHK